MNKIEGNAIRDMFSNIALRYDSINHFLSGGMDFYWRNKLVNRVRKCSPQRVVDLATGSGDVAFTLCKQLPKHIEIVGMDFCLGMLHIAEKKKNQLPYAQNIVFQLGDCMELPLENDSVDVITIAFGYRNFEDRIRGLCEMRRVLKKPHGRLFILEFSQPAKWLRPVYYFYLKYILPKLARYVTRSVYAYEYLVKSIEAFPCRQELSERILSVGFSNVEVHPLTGGIVAIHEASL